MREHYHTPVLLLDEVRDAWRSEPRDHRVALAVILTVAVALRLAHLAQPMRYDESLTYLDFVRSPLAQALSRYHHANNHIFHTLLVKAAAGVFGSAPWALRLPALLAGVLLVPATWAVSHALYGARAALLAAAIVSASGVLTLYSTNARGYSIMVLAFLLLILNAVRLMRTPSRADWVTFTMVAVLGLWTIPVALYPIGAVALWLGLSFVVDGRRAELRRLAAALAIVAILTALLYAPVFQRAGLGALTSDNFVVSSPWPDFLSGLVDSGSEALASWGLGVPPLFSFVLLLCAVHAVTRHASLSATRVGLPLAAFVWSAWFLVASHRAPFARVWMWLLPLAAALAGAGIVALLEKRVWTKRLSERRVPLLASLLAAGTAASVALSGGVRVTADTGAYVDAETAAAAIMTVARPGDRIVAAAPASAPLTYYLLRLGMDPSLLTLDEAQAERLVVVVNESGGQALGPILSSTPARDTTRFAVSIANALPGSTIFVFERRHAQK